MMGNKGSGVCVIFWYLFRKHCCSLFFNHDSNLILLYIWLERKNEKTGLTQSELYEKMSFEEEQAYFSLQGNLFNLPSTFDASLIYKLRHRK